MLNHIAQSKKQLVQQNEKIEIDVALLNELTARQNYSFESNGK